MTCNDLWAFVARSKATPGGIYVTTSELSAVKHHVQACRACSDRAAREWQKIPVEKRERALRNIPELRQAVDEFEATDPEAP